MKHLLLTTIAALVLVVCGESQQSTSTKEAKPVEPFVEAELPNSLPGKSTDISIWDAARTGNILSVNQLLKTGPRVMQQVKLDGLLCIGRLGWGTRKSPNY